MNTAEKVRTLFAHAGIEIGGSEPWDIQIVDDRAYTAVLSGHSIAIGEAYMNGWWDCEDIATLVAKLYQSSLLTKLLETDGWWLVMKGFFLNLQSRARAFQVGIEHYDLGNDLYTMMLDKRMVYTSAIWNGVNTLDQAQEQKLERVCRQLGLKRGDRVLDIGCGWGSFMKYASEKYHASCVGLTVSKEQAALGQQMCAGLPIEFVISDYRDYTNTEPFDHIVSIEMIEAVGPKNFRTFFKKAHELLTPGGRFMLQAIVDRDPRPVPNPWIERYIFPNGVLPSLVQLERATRNLFQIETMKNIGRDYDPTLMAWWDNFSRGYDALVAKNPRYNTRFYRMWKFYLHICAGAFRSNKILDHQILYSKLAA